MYRLFHLDERGAIWHSIKQECSWFMGNLGFMKSKPLVCRAFAENRRKSRYPSPLFYGFPRPQLYPHGKRRCSAPGAPAHSRRKPIWHASKKCDHVEKATEFQREAMSPDGCSLGGACLTRLLALEKIPVEPLKARLDKDSRSNWSKYRICSIALLLYTF